MKKIFWYMALFFLFMFIFFKSDTWETYKEIEIKRGIEYMNVRHRLRWDRFFNYIKEIPRSILESDILKGLAVR